MSAFGRGQAGEVGREVIEAVRSVVFELNNLGRSARQASGGGVGLGGGLGSAAGSIVGGAGGFVMNAAALAARHAAVDVAAGVANDFFRFGGQMDARDSVNSQMLRAASNLPIIGDKFADIRDPLQAAGARVAAITGQIARAGGVVDPTERSALFDMTHAEEKRAKDEEKEVAKLTGAKTSEEFDAVAVMKDLVEEMKTLGGVLANLTGALGIFKGIPTFR